MTARAAQYIATFYSHFAAISFAKRLDAMDVTRRLMVVPESLNSSCGTCVMFEAESARPFTSAAELEHIYELDAGTPSLVYRAARAS